MIRSGIWGKIWWVKCQEPGMPKKNYFNKAKTTPIFGYCDFTAN